jgi:hypothetical protein
VHAAIEEECIASDEEGVGALARKGCKGRIDLADRTGFDPSRINPTIGIAGCCALAASATRLLNPQFLE